MNEPKQKSTIDAAVKGILDEAKNNDSLLLLDEGSEYLHAFWLQILIEMQKRKKFVGNQRVNLAGLVEGGGWAVFAISLVELIGPDGVPLADKLQPTKEKGEVPVPPKTNRNLEAQTGYTSPEDALFHEGKTK